MTNSQRLATVRAHLRWWLCDNVTPNRSESKRFDQPESGSDETNGPDVNLAESSEGTSDPATPESKTAEESDRDTATSPQITSESILIRDGFYAGRTFEAIALGQTFRASWFMEQDELKIHGTGGEVVAVYQGEAITSEHETIVHPADEGPISIPMPVAQTQRSSGEASDSDDQGQISKAA